MEEKEVMNQEQVVRFIERRRYRQGDPVIERELREKKVPESVIKAAFELLANAVTTEKKPLTPEFLARCAENTPDLNQSPFVRQAEAMDLLGPGEGGIRINTRD